MLHVAAYKHADMPDDNPAAAALNNVVAVRKAMRALARAGVLRFMQLSSDKAGHLAGLIGRTKRFAELLVQGRVVAF